jgi:hypothetical protein
LNYFLRLSFSIADATNQNAADSTSAMIEMLVRIRIKRPGTVSSAGSLKLLTAYAVTVTTKVCTAEPMPSLTVTVTVAVPTAMGVNVNDPDDAGLV